MGPGEIPVPCTSTVFCRGDAHAHGHVLVFALRMANKLEADLGFSSCGLEAQRRSDLVIFVTHS